jgi:16S rRNA (uracil1498-N3)-methyltransferase
MHAHAEMVLDKAQTNYLINVLRMKEGSSLLVFNGKDGEWRASLSNSTKKSTVIVLVEQTRKQTAATDIWLCFAPLKTARLDYIVQKAVEMGVSRLVPTLTHRTQVSRLKMDRMRANVIEAAEQCGILTVPSVDEEIKLPKLLATLSEDRSVIFCDEAAEIADPIAVLKNLKKHNPIAVLIGPEGGFDSEERQMILARESTLVIALGPRILRADTAAVAALTVVQLAAGDWYEGD